MNVKELIENRNSKVAQMEKLLTTAKAENRLPSEDEKKQFANLEKEVKDIDATVAMYDQMAEMSMKPVPSAPVEMTNAERDHKAFENAIRGIVNTDTPTMPADAKTLIPTTVWNEIISQVIEISPVFSMADRYNITGNLVLPKYDAQNSSIVMQYADEGTTAESGKVVISQITLGGFLARCLAKISKSLINNSNFDIVGFVEAKMAQAIALYFEHEILFGTVGKVEGLKGITSDMTVTTATATKITSDELMDVQDKVIDNYQANSVWIMNRETRNAIRKLKDNEGDYLLNRDFTAKWGYTLLGKDVYCSDAMDKMLTGKTTIYYGDFSGLAVKVSEDANMQVLQERYAEEHLLGILAFVEWDAKVADTQKLAKLVMGAGK
jgi:HK97 family phage major capsid protein|nr:MAG TPA: major capsid protein [Caudoviricetes sp.]